MNKLKNIIEIWRWAIVLFWVSLLSFMATGSATYNALSTAHTLSYFLVIASFVCIMGLPIYYAITARRRIIFTFLTVLLFNAVGSILMYFYFKKSLKVNS